MYLQTNAAVYLQVFDKSNLFGFFTTGLVSTIDMMHTK